MLNIHLLPNSLEINFQKKRKEKKRKEKKKKKKRKGKEKVQIVHFNHVSSLKFLFRYIDDRSNSSIVANQVLKFLFTPIGP